MSSSSWLDSTMVASGNPAASRSRAACTLEIREVAGVEPDPHRFVTAPAQLLEHGNRIGHARFECVDGVDEQQAVVRIHVGVRLERRPLTLTEGEEQLHHRVGVRARWADPTGVADCCVRRADGTADQGRP